MKKTEQKNKKMATITISRKEYRALLDLKARLFAMPPIRDRRAIISALQKTGHYSEKFLRSLVRGLKRSDYFKKQ